LTPPGLLDAPLAFVPVDHNDASIAVQSPGRDQRAIGVLSLGLDAPKPVRVVWRRLFRAGLMAIGLWACPQAAHAADRHLENAFEAAQWARLSSAGRSK
jgi:hypothetical protein